MPTRSAIGNVLWFLLAGWYLRWPPVTGVSLCITIIGIPLGIANFKLIPSRSHRSGARMIAIDEVAPGDAIIVAAGADARTCVQASRM